MFVYKHTGTTELALLVVKPRPHLAESLKFPYIEHLCTGILGKGSLHSGILT